MKQNILKKFGAHCKDTCKWLFDMKDWKMLFRSVPGLVTALFVVCTIAMNLGANKIVWNGLIVDGNPWVSITGGLFLSWAVFLIMDIMTRTFGVKASIKLNLLGAGINAIVVIFLGLISLFPAKYPYEGASNFFDTVFGFKALAAPQPWQILLSSTIAYIISGIANALINGGVGLLFKKNPNSKSAFFCRSYISTMFGQFIDNFIFGALAFVVFAKFYTLPTALGIAIVGALFELICEIIFSPAGYRICKKWQTEGVGKEYLAYCREKEIKKDPGRVDLDHLTN